MQNQLFQLLIVNAVLRGFGGPCDTGDLSLGGGSLGACLGAQVPELGYNLVRGDEE